MKSYKMKDIQFAISLLCIANTITFGYAGSSNHCLLPVTVGNCTSLLPRFYFNSGNKRCEAFFYTGCGGNENNFDTLLDCHEACQSHLTSARARFAGQTPWPTTPE